jgi:hypothetical protein
VGPESLFRPSLRPRDYQKFTLVPLVPISVRIELVLLAYNLKGDRISLERGLVEGVTPVVFYIDLARA